MPRLDRVKRDAAGCCGTQYPGSVQFTSPAPNVSISDIAQCAAKTADDG